MLAVHVSSIEYNDYELRLKLHSEYCKHWLATDQMLLLFNVTTTQIGHLMTDCQGGTRAQEVEDSKRLNNAEILVTQLPIKNISFGALNNIQQDPSSHSRQFTPSTVTWQIMVETFPRVLTLSKSICSDTRRYYRVINSHMGVQIHWLLASHSGSDIDKRQPKHWPSLVTRGVTSTRDNRYTGLH